MAPAERGMRRCKLGIDEEAQITWGMFPFFPDDGLLVVGEALKILGGTEVPRGWPQPRLPSWSHAITSPKRAAR